MSNHDIVISKRNVKRLMKEKSLTQIKLAEIAGIKQTRVSRILSENNSDFFTIPQLVDIAEYFCISLDELIGLKQKQEMPKYETLSDIASALFALSDCRTCLSFKNIEIPYTFTHRNGTKEERKKTRTAVYFDTEAINQFMAEWKIITQDIKDISCKDELYNLWKNKKIEDLSNNKREYNYYTLFGYVKTFYDDLYYDWYYDEPFDLLLPDEMEALKEVQERYEQGFIAYDEWFENIEHINDIIDSYCKSAKRGFNIPSNNE